jgi:hypothetical protein
VGARPEPGVCRILAAGDAYTFGYGVRAADAWPRRAERRLRRQGRVEVLNGGFPDLDVERQRRRLRRLVAALAPRVVVVTFSWWNVPLPRPAPGARPAKWSPGWVIANLEQRAARLGGHSALVHEALRLAREAATPRLFAPSGLAQEIEPLARTPAELGDRWRRTREALAGMAGDTAAAGARLLLVVTPLDVQVDRRRNALYRSGRLAYPAHGFVEVDYVEADVMPTALRRFAAEARIELLDLTPAFRARRALPLFLREDYHAAPAGHRLIAREVARWVLGARTCP